jgi:DNA processing protein
VDQKAHLLSLRTGRPTVVFIPAGLEKIYPTSLQEWIPEILSMGGALLSEYENRQPMQKHFFAQRNRLISALGKATLVIEARRHSGTLLTAKEAIEQSRPLWVLPGHPMDFHCQGSLELLIEGATPVTSATDLSDLFNSEVQGLSALAPRSAKYLVGLRRVTH